MRDSLQLTMLSRLAHKSLSALRTRSLLAGAAAPRRSYGNVTKECQDQLLALGITNKNIVFNPS